MPGGQPQPLLRFIRKLTAPGSAAENTDAKLLARFVGQQDETAFAALVQRHGPMVLGVCRRVLGDLHDAEDACQAAFLVLARKARSLARPEALGNWLYGVAYRTALKARAEAIRRRARESQVAARAVRDPAAELILQELRLLLDDELNRLPAKYRAPFVLCFLAGQTHEEAALTLGCPRKTITTRLTRARERLHARLLRRGLTLSAAAFAAALSRDRASAAGPATAVVDSTVGAARQIAAGAAPAAGTVSARVAALTEGVLRAMFVTRLKKTAMLVLLLTAVATGAGVWTYQALAGGDGTAGERAGTVRAADDGKKAEDAKPAEDKGAKTDKERLQGTWVAVSGEQDGKKLPEEKVKDGQLILTADKVSLTPPTGVAHEGTYTIDPDKKPKEIDLIFGEVTRMGIYELKGTTLKLMFSENGRPADFDAGGATLVVFEKKK
jgi:RNA polymerase sigma-70 factor (ECF subfamily)